MNQADQRLAALREHLTPVFWAVFDPDSSTHGNVQAALDKAMPIIADALEAALPGDDDWEYEVSYSDRSAPGVDGYRLRRAVGPMTLSQAQRFAEEAANPKIRRRVKGVGPGPWEPVEEVPRG